MILSNKLKILLSVVFILTSLGSFSCKNQEKTKIDFIEVRITRWTALEGGETLLLRKIDKDWQATLLGDSSRFSCPYSKSAQPKSSWDNLWLALQKEGLLEIPDGKYQAKRWQDGSGFSVEVFHQNKFKRYSFFLPEKLKTKESEQMLRIGDLVNQEFGSPVFKGEYDRGDVGMYIIEICKNFTSN